MGKIVHLTGECLTADGKCPEGQPGEEDTWELVQEKIDGSEMIMFSRSDCDHCQKLAQFLQRKQVPLKIVNLDKVPNGDEIREELKKHTGKSAPNLFVKGVQIGSSEESIEAWRNGKIQKLLHSS